jgi:hypothetical protein
MSADKAVGILFQAVSEVKREHRLLFIAKMLFNPTSKELATMTVGRLFQLSSERLPRKVRRKVDAFLMEEAEGLENVDRIVRSRNYGGKYPVSRQSIWRWMKAVPLTAKIAANQVKGVLLALAFFAAKVWKVILKDTCSPEEAEQVMGLLPASSKTVKRV